MFEQKQKTLIGGEKKEKPTGATNAFVKAAKIAGSVTVSGNGAKKYGTSGDDFLDQFANASRYLQPRTYAEVEKDMTLLWGQDPLKCLKLMVYFRIITRETVIVIPEGEEKLDTQRGQGLKSETYWRLIWLAINHRSTFMANFHYFVAAGSWSDIFEIMYLDVQYNGWENRKLPWAFLLNAIVAGLENPRTSELIKKFMPTISSYTGSLTRQAHKVVGYALAYRLFGELVKDEKDDEKRKTIVRSSYAKLKSSGEAHEWQQLISQEKFLQINFDSIAGKALAQLVSSKFLKNNGLQDKYQKWIQQRPTAKFTGFVHELAIPYGGCDYSGRPKCSLTNIQRMTINSQFEGLLEKARSGMNTQTRLLVVRDISSSMTSKAVGAKVSAYEVAKAFSIYFGRLLDGPFANHYALFASNCVMKTWVGNNFCQLWENETIPGFGSTNFMSVADLLVRCHREMHVPENEFPNGILCISDGDFNYYKPNETNFKSFKEKLLSAGFSKEFVDDFKIVLWDIPNNYYGDRKTARFDELGKNFFYMSGFDPSGIAFLTGTKYMEKIPKTPEELMEAALNQELLNRLTIPKFRPQKKSIKPNNRKNNEIKHRTCH